MKEQNQHSELPKTPILDGLKKEHSLTTPSGYFEQLPTKLLQIASNEKKSNIVSIKKQLIFVSCIAATILILIFIYNDSKTSITNNPIALTNNFENLTFEELENEFLDYDADELISEINFNNSDELLFYFEEMQQPQQQTIEVYEEDFDFYFETENLDYY